MNQNRASQQNISPSTTVIGIQLLYCCICCIEQWVKHCIWMITQVFLYRRLTRVMIHTHLWILCPDHLMTFTAQSQSVNLSNSYLNHFYTHFHLKQIWTVCIVPLSLSDCSLQCSWWHLHSWSSVQIFWIWEPSRNFSKQTLNSLYSMIWTYWCSSAINHHYEIINIIFKVTVKLIECYEHISPLLNLTVK